MGVPTKMRHRRILIEVPLVRFFHSLRAWERGDEGSAGRLGSLPFGLQPTEQVSKRDETAEI